MRKLTKTAAVVASMAVMAMGTTMMASAATEGWVQSGSNWYYYIKGDKASNQWVKAGDDWYFVDDEGRMVKNAFVRIDRFDSDNAEVLRDKDIHDELGKDDIDDDSDFYYIGNDGKMVTGWVEMSASSIYASPNSGSSTKVWYYFGSTGRMYVNEWVYSTDKWYALSPNGQMYAEAAVNNDLVNWDDEDFYYMDKNGGLVKGWYKTTDNPAGSDAKVYIENDDDDNKLDDFSPIIFPGKDGKDEWVYGDPVSGVLADEEWKEISGKWYYFGIDARTTREGVKDDFLNVYLANFELDALVPELGEGIVATGSALHLTKYDDINEYTQYERKDKPDAKAVDKYAMLSDQIIAWANHNSKKDEEKINYFYLGKNGDALTTWKEIEDDYYICGNSKGELYHDTIAKINSKYYYFNANGVCDYKYLNNTADYVVVLGGYEATKGIGMKGLYFYETNRENDSNSEGNTDDIRRSLYSGVNYANLADIKEILTEVGCESVTFGNTRKVKVASLTESEAVAAYSVYVANVNDPYSKEALISNISSTVSIYKLRTSSATEKQKVTLNVK